MTLQDLNTLEADAARESLQRCCGSRKWIASMISRRPFPDVQDMISASDSIWWSLAKEDWLEAFSNHPKIGEKGQGWSAEEQRGMDAAARETAAEMGRLNRLYENNFGWIFIICATGKTADEMRELLEQRLKNEASAELKIAASEQAEITHLRIRKLLKQ